MFPFCIVPPPSRSPAHPTPCSHPSHPLPTPHPSPPQTSPTFLPPVHPPFPFLCLPPCSWLAWWRSTRWRCPPSLCAMKTSRWRWVRQCAVTAVAAVTTVTTVAVVMLHHPLCELWFCWLAGRAHAMVNYRWGARWGGGCGGLTHACCLCANDIQLCDVHHVARMLASKLLHMPTRLLCHPQTCFKCTPVCNRRRTRWLGLRASPRCGTTSGFPCSALWAKSHPPKSTPFSTSARACLCR